MGRKHYGERCNCSLQAISPFPTVFSKDLYYRPMFGKGLNLDSHRQPFVTSPLWLLFPNDRFIVLPTCSSLHRHSCLTIYNDDQSLPHIYYIHYNVWTSAPCKQRYLHVNMLVIPHFMSL